MPKVIELKRPNGEHGMYAIQCPGCKCLHGFDKRWTFNNDFEKPTFSPSMLINQDNEKSRCHSFVTNGQIQFLNDCFHELKGQTINLEDVDD